MRPSLLILAAAAAVFVWTTGGLLPETVASHFGASGDPNGFMTRTFYIGIMLVVIVGVPLLLVAVTGMALSNPNARINLPNGDYWLAPERRGNTVEFLRLHAARFASMLVVFLCYVHWLVVRANDVHPPRLDARWLIGGLVVFTAGLVLWVTLLFNRFRIRP